MKRRQRVSWAWRLRYWPGRQVERLALRLSSNAHQLKCDDQCPCFTDGQHDRSYIP